MGCLSLNVKGWGFVSFLWFWFFLGRILVSLRGPIVFVVVAFLLFFLQ